MFKRPRYGFSFVFLALFCFSSLKAQITAQKELIYQDWIYEDNIKTVLLYPKSEDLERNLSPPVSALESNWPLILEFDELGTNRGDYYLKIIHCNADWTKSNLNDIEYMPDFNEFPLNQYQFSFNTKVAYVHYNFELPVMKRSGNYLLIVYRNGNEKDLMFSKRFVVYETLVTVIPNVRASVNVSLINENQQVDFGIDYSNFPLYNPVEQVKTIIRQNYRWDNAITNLKPLYVREFEKKLEYTYTNLENNFKGLNVFRRFDMQSIRFLGFNMAEIDRTGKDNRVRLQSDKSRQKEPYSLWKDYHGGYIINHYESQRGDTEGDYVKVYFTLKADQPAEGEVYIRGAFNQYLISDLYKMTYFPEEKAYQKSILMKQGSYNYIYSFRPKGQNKPDDTYFEGSHQQTFNLYDIFVYYRPPTDKADRVIGYANFGTY